MVIEQNMLRRSAVKTMASIVGSDELTGRSRHRSSVPFTPSVMREKATSSSSLSTSGGGQQSRGLPVGKWRCARLCRVGPPVQCSTNGRR